MERLAFEYYQYKGNTYKVMGFANMKCPVSREWVIAVQYHKYRRPNELYVREVGDFIDKFVGVPL